MSLSRSDNMFTFRFWTDANHIFDIVDTPQDLCSIHARWTRCAYYENRCFKGIRSLFLVLLEIDVLVHHMGFILVYENLVMIELRTHNIILVFDLIEILVLLLLKFDRIFDSILPNNVTAIFFFIKLRPWPFSFRYLIPGIILLRSVKSLLYILRYFHPKTPNNFQNT